MSSAVTKFKASGRKTCQTFTRLMPAEHASRRGPPYVVSRGNASRRGNFPFRAIIIRSFYYSRILRRSRRFYARPGVSGANVESAPTRLCRTGRALHALRAKHTYTAIRNV